MITTVHNTKKPLISPYEVMLLKGSVLLMAVICALVYMLAATVAGWGA